MEFEEAEKMLKYISKDKMKCWLVPFKYDWRDLIMDYAENCIETDKHFYDIPEDAEIEIGLNRRQADLIDGYVPLVLIRLEDSDEELSSVTPTEYLMDSEGRIITLSDFEKELGALDLSVCYDTYTPVDIYHSELDTGDCNEHTTEVESHEKNIEFDYDLYVLPFYRDILYSEKLEETVMEYKALKEAEKDYETLKEEMER